MRRTFFLLLAFGAAAATPFACSSQVVDAVDSVETGEAGMMGSGGTVAGSGGSAGNAGTAGSGASAGSGTACPDGGSDVDRDGDGTPDCIDGCPEDPLKTSSGLCGCGLADTAPEGGVTCADLVGLLAHRYAFNGTGTRAVNTASGGTFDGDIVNGAALSGQGTLMLAGQQSEQFVGLPNGILSGLPVGAPVTGSVTLEAWLEWTPGAPWQRIFDFGNSDAPEGQQGSGGLSYLFLTPRTPLDPNLTVVAPQNQKLRVAYKRPGGGEYEVTLDAPIALPSGAGIVTHVAVVIDGTLKQMSLYVDGDLQDGVAYFRNPGGPAFTQMTGVYDWSEPVPAGDGGTVVPPAIDLTALDDVNNWLGRSQFVADAELQATYYEFRIYAGPLTPELVKISYSAGPDAQFLQ